jgi:hypothetical protein
MLTDMTLGQYYPGDSFLHRMDPRAKILCTMIFIIAIFLANNRFPTFSWPLSRSARFPYPACLTSLYGEP